MLIVAEESKLVGVEEVSAVGKESKAIDKALRVILVHVERIFWERPDDGLL